MKSIISFSLLSLSLCGSAYSASLWDKAKDVAGSTADMVSETANDVSDAVSGDEESPEVTRIKIDQMESDSLLRLFREVPSAREAFDNSPAHAVFDTRKMSFLITTGFGSGVAEDRETGSRVYMKMATGGLNIGYGAQFYQVIFIFPSSASYTSFVENGWDANADANAVAGSDDEKATLRLPDGTRVYQLNDKGLMLSASLTGTKYWKWDELN